MLLSGTEFGREPHPGAARRHVRLHAKFTCTASR